MVGRRGGCTRSRADTDAAWLGAGDNAGQCWRCSRGEGHRGRRHDTGSFRRTFWRRSLRPFPRRWLPSFPWRVLSPPCVYRAALLSPAAILCRLLPLSVLCTGVSLSAGLDRLWSAADLRLPAPLRSLPLLAPSLPSSFLRPPVPALSLDVAIATSRDSKQVLRFEGLRNRPGALGFKGSS